MLQDYSNLYNLKMPWLQTLSQKYVTLKKNASRLPAELIKPHRILYSGFDHSSKISLGAFKIFSIPNQQEVS